MTAEAPPIPFIDLKAQQARIADGLRRRIDRVLGHGAYILGPEVAELEAALAGFTGAGFCLTCSSGTDALLLPLMAWGVGPGDAVLVPSFTFVATAEVVVLAGATPVFVDVLEHDFTIDPAGLEPGIAAAEAAGLRPRVVVPVDLFGQPADYPAIRPIAEAHGLKVLGDAAQSFGATLDGGRVGTFADATATSFFPAKPLGCYGDGGAVFSNDSALIDVMRSIRVHGQGADKYDNVRIGINGRLDTLQAAVLLEKLAIFPDEIAARQRIADRYAAGLGDAMGVPSVRFGATSVWAQFTITTDRRDRVAASLQAAGVPTAIYYAKPLHRQDAYRHYPCAAGALPVSDHLSARVLSLPMHPYLDTVVQDRIIAAVHAAHQK
ncbi:MAG: DegT/DnrJ/EryC1/StrS aminotransferase family protein [Rhodospirillales bacterium]|nr:MAG: DegT/DnrJ/EryC1/StrS aminotransferase family protein [Rhodospirillales bacterium]